MIRLRIPTGQPPISSWRSTVHGDLGADCRFEDAERDCNAAVARQPGHLKALYRRALARKGLENYTAALDGELKGENVT